MIEKLLKVIQRSIKQLPFGPANRSDRRGAYTYTIRGSNERAKDEYMTRTVFPRLPLIGWGVMLHEIHRPDADPHEHNHPWKWFLSIVLRGGYVESRNSDPPIKVPGGWLANTQLHVVRRFNWKTNKDFHRIACLLGTSVWTIVITGPRVQEWGFYTQGGVVPWKKYLGIE